ncbi:MAG: 30S ribosome-binding factor RbfA [Lewinellaceae bacterium]|nr:30S ribosome-binding factor RbfA [Saprospiraceae bacterium]MCB9339049.1 30S ribosome-binding factor RbfA [Lewinellaceae bacterium]
MANIRQKQVAEMIKRHFSTMLQQEGTYIYGTEPFVTVTEVQMTPDFSIAKIYLSVFNLENKQEVILHMEDNYYRLKQALASRIHKQIRRIPEMQFYLDDMLDEMEKVEMLFQKLEQDNQMGTRDEEE